MNMKIGITGSKGKIGQRLTALGCEPLLCDITNRDEVYREINRVRPDVIIHAAAISSIEECERDYDKAIAVNSIGANNVFELADDVIGTGKVCLLSSEQVFDGEVGNYKETDEPNPINDYGLVKFAAEGIAKLYDCKVLRLSRCVSSKDLDLKNLKASTILERSYCHIDFTSQAIMEYALRFNDMPDLLHYGGAKTLSFYEFMCLLWGEGNVMAYHKWNEKMPPRPKKCGLDVSLAKSLGLPVFSPQETVERLSWLETSPAQS